MLRSMFFENLLNNRFQAIFCIEIKNPLNKFVDNNTSILKSKEMPICIPIIFIRVFLKKYFQTFAFVH